MKPPSSRRTAILLIRLRLIGDVVFTTPVIRALRRALPDAYLAYLVEEDAAAVVSGNPHLDEVIIVRRSRGLARIFDDLRLASQLRRRRFDTVIDMHGGPRSGWLTLATGAPQRIGYAIPGRQWMYTRTVPRCRELRPRHSVINQWDLLEAVEGWNGTTPDPVHDSVEMVSDARADQTVGHRLAARGVQPNHELIVIHVSAGNPVRRWPEDAFVRLVIGLTAHPARRVIVSSGPSDRAAAARIVRRAREALDGSVSSRIVDFGEFDLPELRALVARSRLFVGGDTGPLHIAATTATPVIGIYGPTLPARSAPWRDPAYLTESLGVAGLNCRPCNQRHCVPGDFRCLTTLQSDDVLAAAERLLKRTA
jgi:ADP-heptose:LPS heptosyltransferase